MLVMSLFAHPRTQSVLAESTLGLLLVVGSMDCSAAEELRNLRNHQKNLVDDCNFNLFFQASVNVF